METHGAHRNVTVTEDKSGVTAADKAAAKSCEQSCGKQESGVGNANKGVKDC